MIQPLIMIVSEVNKNEIGEERPILSTVLETCHPYPAENIYAARFVCSKHVLANFSIQFNNYVCCFLKSFVSKVGSVDDLSLRQS